MLFLPFAAFVGIASAAFTPCPLLGPRFPKPSGIADSPVTQKALSQLQSVLDEGIRTSNTSNGPIYPNTTSFSIVLFDASPVASEDDAFFFEYHHTASALQAASSGARDVSVDSVYRIGGLTEVFNVWTFLAEAGGSHWDEPVTQWIPELAAASASYDALQQSVDHVDWNDVTLGDLAANLAGIQRSCQSSRSVHGPDLGTTESCTYSRDAFFNAVAQQPPAHPVASTPVKSVAGFQMLAYALESTCNKSFETILTDRILQPLKLSQTSLTVPQDLTNAVIPVNDVASLWSLDLGDQAFASGIYSSAADMAKAGKAILSSSVIPSTLTRRWLKPVAHTLNLLNTVGRPWEIYANAGEITDPVVEAFTGRGNFGLYSSYFGVVPDFDIGFAILAADTSGNPDLNAYSDLLSDVVPAFEQLAQQQAKSNFASAYTLDAGSLLNLTTVDPREPGLVVETLLNGGQDVKAQYAEALGINTAALDFRLYPTHLSAPSDGGSRIAFRALFQAIDAPEDGGTPTCETWREADQLFIGQAAADLFVFETDESGSAIAVEIPALSLVLPRE